MAGLSSFLLMKRFFFLMRGGPLALLVLLWLAGPVVRAQAPAWQMAVAVDQPSGTFSYGEATVADANGNVYLTGSFGGTISLGTISLTSIGSIDVFVAKWNTTTNRFIWAQRAGNADFTHTTAVAVNGPSVYISGYFSGPTIDFGSTTLVNSVAGGYSLDGFVVKLTDAGTTSIFSWAQRLGGSGTDMVNALAVSGTNVYAAGSFTSATLSLGSVSVVNAGLGDDGFVAKLIDGGATCGIAWAKQLGGNSSDFVTALAVTNATVYIAGSFTSPTATFGNTTLTNVGQQFSDDVFVAKLLDAGSSASFAWAQQAGGPDRDNVTALAVNGPNIYVAGTFAGPSVNFGGATLLNANNDGSGDVFVAKIVDTGAGGTFNWAERGGGLGDDKPFTIVNVGASICLAGAFSGPTATFGSQLLTNTAPNTREIFVTKIADLGTSASFTWAQQAGGTGNDYVNAMAVSGTRLYMTGFIAPPAIFGSLNIGSQLGSQTGFLASLTDPTLTATTAAQGALSFSLAPNPARASTTVQLPARPGTATATLTLTDALGRTLRTETISLPAGLRHELDLTGLAPGLYAVQVRAGAISGTQRLVVE